MAQDIHRPSTPEGGTLDGAHSYPSVAPPEEAEERSNPGSAQDVNTSPLPAKHWLPFSLRRPFLLFLAILCLLMAIAGEVMRQYSKHNHGLVHLETYKSLGLAAGLFVYVPTTVAVLLVTLWNICALDVLRLEPYFQLANQEGASGSVLFTNYSFTYGILAPIRALRNQHWVVAIVSSVALLLRTMLPSLMSGLIVLNEMNIVTMKPINTWPDLINLETQDVMLSYEASHSRNSSEFHADTFFFYQTHNYAIPPIVRLPEDDSEASTWKMNETAYWADLNCVEVSLKNIIPDINPTNSTSSTTLTWNVTDIAFDKLPYSGDADSCMVSFLLNSNMPVREGSYQVRHWEPLNVNGSATDSATMNITGCESFALFGLSINMGSSLKNFSSDATSFGCSSRYLKGKAEIAFPVNTSFVDAKHVLGPTESVSSSQFSISSFESLLHTKYSNANLVTPGSRHQISSLTTSTGVNGTLLSDLTPVDIKDYQSEIRQLWNHNFVNSMRQFFNTTGDPTPVDARQITDTTLYQVTSRSALMAEGLLLVAFLVLIGLFFLYPRRLNFLCGDPNSIAAQCAILTDTFAAGNSLIRSEIAFDRATPRQLRRFARTLSCRWIDTPDGKRIDIVPNDPNLPFLELPSSRLRRNPRPHFLTPPWFLIECAVMAGVLAAFGVAFQYVRLDKINSNSAGVTFIYYFLIYGPTIIASMIGSLFISIYRHLSNLEPWVRLQKGMAVAKQSITANYGSQTPIVSWMTFRHSAPPILVMLSLMCFLDMFLTVASSGMFEPILYNSTVPTSSLSARYNQSRFLNPPVRVEFNGNSLISDSLVMGYSLLAWTTPDTSFYPMVIHNNDPDYDWEEYNAIARGVGVDLQCSKLPTSASSHDRSTGNLYWTYQPYSDIDTNCTVEFQQPVSEHRLFNESVYFRGPMNASDICQKTFMVITYNDFDSINATSGDNSTVFQCAPQIQIQDFVIDFEYEGTVDDWEPVAGSAITSGEMFQNASASLVPFTQAFLRQTRLARQDINPNQYDWAVLLVRQVHDTFDDSDSLDLSLLKQAVQLGYQSTFSTYLSLWRDIYFDPILHNTSFIPGTTTDTFYGIEPSYTTIFIILVLLSIDLSVLMAVFWFRHRHYNGPQIPRSIGSLIPLIANSRILGDVRDTAGWTEAKRREHLDKLGRKYRYGEYTLPNGEKRLALDYDEKPLYEPFDEQQHELGDICVDPIPDQDAEPPSAAVSTTQLINEHNDRS
ncbi:hypothetical protein N7456_013046 [Penicillium angulare]|uniref:Uncharacterized protein n=1 Tax=Penicillium angulare TaxID=116970 RepID=A0A9W9EKZ5_9EURO|nr:hypothetical protein N7456_013046 [Penicillium angulare]